MQEWCMEHPIMTFFIVMSLLSQPIVVIKHIRKDRGHKSRQGLGKEP